MTAATIPPLFLQGDRPTETEVAQISSNWLASLGELVQHKTHASVNELFLDDCWWRDILTLGWDWTSKHGQKAIEDYVRGSQHALTDLKIITEGILSPRLAEMGGMQWIEFAFTFSTHFGTGRGFVRLGNAEPGKWKAWLCFTWLEELKQSKAKPYDGEGLQVLVVGAGQAGLMLAAHLKQIGLKFLIVDTNERLGDSWRRRYDILQSHTPRYSDHYPFLKFPDSLPKWMYRDDMADWQEHYAKSMGLDVQLRTAARDITYDEASRQYSVQLAGSAGVKTVRTNHVVLATGIFDDEPVHPTFANESSFQGRIYHTSSHKSAALLPDVINQKIVIVGAGTSAHDVAQDFVENSAKSVTIVQRGPIFVCTRDTMEATFEALSNTPGFTTEDVDFIGNSFPYAVLKAMGPMQAQAMTTMDKDILDKLETVGMKVVRGDDGFSAIEFAFEKAGSMYIDQGACEMIADGRIKVKRSPNGIKGFDENGLVLADGTKLPADVVILATGFHRNDKTVAKLLGTEVRAKVQNFGHIDQESERTGWWRPTGVPGFWYMTGNFRWARQYSKVLALQIQAVEDGLNVTHYA